MQKANLFSGLCSLEQDRRIDRGSEHAREKVHFCYPVGALFPCPNGLTLGDNVNIHLAQEDEQITSHRVGFSSFIYINPFTFGFQ